MLVEVRKNSTFFSPMQTDPCNFREKLFQGIDQDYNVTNMALVVEVLCELENVHMSREELEVTRLGKHINQLRKNTTDKSLAGRAKNLIKKWRDLLAAPSGPGPGGGNSHNNNNSSLATNGNSGSRLDNAVANSSPRLPPSGHAPSQRGPAKSRPAPHLANSHRDNRQSPASKVTHPPVSKPPPHIAKSRTPVSSPRVPPRDSRDPSPSLQKSQSARNSVPQSHHVRKQAAPLSPAKPAQVKALSNGSGSRDSPEVVCLDSETSSQASILSVHSVSSRPNSPDASSISIIKSRDVSPIPRSRTSSPAIIASNKRQRPREEAEDSNGREAKQPRLELHNGSSVPSSPNHLKDRPRGKAKTPSRPKQPRQRQPPVVNSGYDLTRQMMQASAAKGKVRTTQELVSSLGIESRIPQPPTSVTDLVPDMEAKSELMDRFFSSQRPRAEDNGSEAGVSEPPSRPSTAVEISSSEVSSAPASRVNTPAVIQPPRESVEDILAQLPPIDAAAILAEVETEVAEEEPEVDGLIPAFRPEVEVTEERIDGLNNGHLEHIGGIRDHSGEFREWHEMAALESKDGELLHILPYSVID